MTNPKSRNDPETKQILESIGRIVAEGESRAPVDEDVLDLVDMVDEQGNAIPPERAMLGALPFPPPAPAGRVGGPVADGGRASEEQVLEALQPLLQAWLDTHMPPIVERLVQRELERGTPRSEPE